MEHVRTRKGPTSNFLYNLSAHLFRRCFSSPSPSLFLPSFFDHAGVFVGISPDTSHFVFLSSSIFSFVFRLANLDDSLPWDNASPRSKSSSFFFWFLSPRVTCSLLPQKKILTVSSANFTIQKYTIVLWDCVRVCVLCVSFGVGRGGTVTCYLTAHPFRFLDPLRVTSSSFCLYPWQGVPIRHGCQSSIGIKSFLSCCGSPLTGSAAV